MCCRGRLPSAVSSKFPEVLFCFEPCLCAHKPAGSSAEEITQFEVDSAVSTRNSRLIGRIRESGPIEGYRTGRSHTRLDFRAAWRYGEGLAEVVAPSPAPQDLSTCCTESTVPGNVFRKRRSREDRPLRWSLAETNWANRSQWPGGSSVCGPSAQYSAIIFC